MTKYLTLFGMCFFVSLVHAANLTPIQVEGVYKDEIIELRTMVLDNETGIMAASTDVVLPPCSGEIAGLGKLEKNTLRFTPYVKTAGGQQCVISVHFNTTGKSGVITEENCLDYHGASCGWEGATLKKVKH